MKNYFIVENSSSPHEDGIVSLVKVLKQKGFKVFLFIGEGNYNRVKDLHLDKIVDEILLLRKYFGILQLLNLRKSNDTVIYNTISVRNTLFTFITSMGKGKNIYYIRNANSWIKYSWHYTKVIDFFTRNVSTFLKKIMLLNNPIILVENRRIKRYLNSNFINRVDVIPFKFPNNNLRFNKVNGRLKFVVPGLIDFSRKNIFDIVEAFIKLNSTEHIKVTLILLGRTKGPIEEKYCREWQNILGVDCFIYYSSFVSVIEFDKVISEADIVISSFKIQHKCSHFCEIYGLTRGSGVDAHAISLGIPLIVNNDYQIDNEYESSTLRFTDSNDLTNIIKKLIYMPEELYRLKLSANLNANNYSIDLIIRDINYLWGNL